MNTSWVDDHFIHKYIWLCCLVPNAYMLAAFSVNMCSHVKIQRNRVNAIISSVLARGVVIAMTENLREIFRQMSLLSSPAPKSSLRLMRSLRSRRAESTRMTCNCSSLFPMPGVDSYNHINIIWTALSLFYLYCIIFIWLSYSTRWIWDVLLLLILRGHSYSEVLSLKVTDMISIFKNCEFNMLANILRHRLL